LHLLYSRFYIKVLNDLGYLPFNEPFAHLFNQGMVLKYSEKTGLVEKMSKSKGNVVNPDDMVREYGSDALRMYILFMGPPELDCEWQDSGLEGVKRFLNRFWNFVTDPVNRELNDKDEHIATTKRMHKLIKDVHTRVENYKPNTAISAFMEWLNDAHAKTMKLGPTSLEKLLVTLSVFAPHITSELLEQTFNKQLQDCKWPTYDESMALEDQVTIAIQVNGKLRGQVIVDKGTSEEKVRKLADTEVEKWLDGKLITKVIFVKDRLINFVVKE
jgi:leucyl-tRNA synthetase